MKPKKKKHNRDIFLQLPGYLLVCSFITTVLSGLLIAFYYIPTPAKAALSISYIQEKVFAGATIITIHHVSGILAILFTMLNLILILPSKKVSDTWIKIWQSGIVLIILFILLRITGYLLSGSNSAGFVLKSILIKLSGTQSPSTSLPTVFDSLSVAFVRVYILHIVTLTGLAGLVLYNHIKGMKRFGSELQPITIQPSIIFAIFIAFVTVISIFIKPIEYTVSHYTENLLANAPWIIQFLVQIKRLLSLPIALIILTLLFIIILSIGNILKKFRS